MNRAAFLLFGLAFGAAGCISIQGASSNAVPLVRAHAESDLDCPQDAIRIEQQVGGKFKAIGCGRKTVYKAACEGLTCTVRGENDPAIPWRDRPAPQPTP